MYRDEIQPFKNIAWLFKPTKFHYVKGDYEYARTRESDLSTFLEVNLSIFLLNILGYCFII